MKIVHLWSEKDYVRMTAFFNIMRKRMSIKNEVLDFTDLAHGEVLALLQQYNLALTVDEVLEIQHHILKRPPTLAECVLWSIQGSEHCSYRSTRKYLKTLVTDGPNIILGAKEDAGIVSVATDHQGLRYGIVMSHESHNHPSQIVPYEGAATGVGGNVRDVSCMGAEVIAIADGLRFGDIHQSKTRWIQQGVVAGIGGYGNPIGVPNIAGDVYYDSAYNDNCLVTVVTLGVVREDQVIHSYAPKSAENHVFILVGKATDNSGFGGASFASANLDIDQQAKNKGAVQEPNAFLKRHLLKANNALYKKLQDRGEIDQVGFKDLGAGGIACASVELADAGGYGAEIFLDQVPTSIAHLPPYVALCSETQERFMWVVPPELVEMIIDHYNVTFALPEIARGAGASVVGKIRTDGQYIVNFQGEAIVNARAEDITRGIVSDRPVLPVDYIGVEPTVVAHDFNAILLQLLGHENIASRLSIFESYDKQVQGRTLIEAGEANAGVLTPFNEDKYPEEIRQVGIALSLDQNPRYNKISAYWGAVNAVVESARNVAAVGALPQALTDCLCFGNPEKPEQMWAFTESIRGMIDACKAIGLKDFPGASLPIIAGNVSLYNESNQQAIPPSPMISCLGNMPDARLAVSSHLRATDSLLMLIGERQNECGGSVYYQLNQELGSRLPQPNLALIAAELHAVNDLIQSGLVLSAHDISDGGIAVTLAEMCFKNSIGVHVNIPSALPLAQILFSETGGFVLEIKRSDLALFEQKCNDYQVPFWTIGQTTAEPQLYIQEVINLPVRSARTVWEQSLREKVS